MPDYPNITTGLNKLSADVFNRVMEDLRGGENNWENLKGMIRDKTEGLEIGGVRLPPWQLCIIGSNFHLDPRDDFDEDEGAPLFYGQYLYEWCSVSSFAMTLHKGSNYGDHVDFPEPGNNYAGGFQFNTLSCPGGIGNPFISDNSAQWPNLFDAHEDDPTSFKSPLNVWDDSRQLSSKKYYWRMADNVEAVAGSGYNLLSGAAMNIAEASNSFYGKDGEYIYPGLSWRGGCIADGITDESLRVKPIKSGTLVFMTLVPFYRSLEDDEYECDRIMSYGRELPDYVNCFTAGPNISACCSGPEGGAAAAATGSIPFFDNSNVDSQTVTGDLYYDKDTKTLHTPNITTDGTSPSLGYSTDLDAVYIGNVHMGRGASTSTITNPDPALFQPWVLTESVRTVEITVDGANALNVGSLNIAFYNSAYGRPTTKIAGSGATIVGNGTGTTVVSYDITLPAGAYWLGCCSNIGTIKIAGTTSRDADQSFIPRTTANLSGSFCIWKSSSDMTSLPESITATSELAPSDDAIPRIGLRYQGA